MGTSHFTSNVAGNVKITVASVNATNLKIGTKIDVPTVNITTSASAPIVNASTKVKTGSYIQMGSRQYIIFGTAPNETLVVAAATHIAKAVNNDASVRGSIYMYRGTSASPGRMWWFTSDAQASPIGLIAN